MKFLLICTLSLFSSLSFAQYEDKCDVMVDPFAGSAGNAPRTTYNVEPGKTLNLCVNFSDVPIVISGLNASLNEPLAWASLKNRSVSLSGTVLETGNEAMNYTNNYIMFWGVNSGDAHSDPYFFLTNQHVQFRVTNKGRKAAPFQIILRFGTM